MGGGELNHGLGGYSDQEWAEIDLGQAYEQAFHPSRLDLALDLQERIPRHIKNLAIISDILNPDLTDTTVVEGLTAAANISAEIENKKK